MALLLATSFAAADEAPLTIAVHGVEPRVGQVMLSVYDAEAAFLKSATREAIVPVGDASSVRAEFTLPAGAYAAAVVYDRNGNGKMDTRFFGIPKEPVAFSNDAKGRFGPASWSDARFEFTPGDAPHEVNLVTVGTE